MRLLLINPNTTSSMTDKMVEAARRVVGSGVEVVAATSAYGPPSIEGYYDEVFSIPPMLECIAAHQDTIDGVVVGCFDDTGVDAARCLVEVPVIGICQGALQAAAVLANRFTVVTMMRRSVPALEHLVRRYGADVACAKVRACEVPVLELEDPHGKAYERIRSEIADAVEQDNAEAIVLGCAGMITLTERLSDEFGLPVVEGVSAAVKAVEGLATLGLHTSSRGGYAAPRQKDYVGDFARYSPATRKA